MATASGVAKRRPRTESGRSRTAADVEAYCLMEPVPPPLVSADRLSEAPARTLDDDWDANP
jgi:hypothetical protein